MASACTKMVTAETSPGACCSKQSRQADKDWLPIRRSQRYTTHPDIGSRADMVNSVAVLDGTKETYNSPPQLEKAT
jgi:hypothetical protein